MSEELKPCPFCGGEADAAIDGEYTIIQCQSCFSRTDGNLTSEMGYHHAKEEWNKRTTDRLEQENAELRASVETKDKLNDSLAKEVLIRSEENEELMGVINVLSNADNHSVSQVRMAVRKARQLLNK